MTIRIASAVTQELLLDVFPGALRYEDEVRWNGQAERVDAFERLLYRDLVVEESRARGSTPSARRGSCSRRPARAAPAPSPQRGRWTGSWQGSPSPPGTLPRAGSLRPGTRSSSARCARPAWAAAASPSCARPVWKRRCSASSPRAARAAVERLAPERVTLPGGRSVKVEYEGGEKPPFVESRLQDFFGLADGPRLAGGRVPLVLHLLAPNGRAQQVTTDLAGFWERHYPALRRELMRRYPRHAWPEDPLHAVPPPSRTDEVALPSP